MTDSGTVLVNAVADRAKQDHCLLAFRAGAMMKRYLITSGVLAIGVFYGPLNASSQAVAPIVARPIEQAISVLPRNTPVQLSLNETLNTKSKQTRKGNTFTLSVARDVVLRRYIVIPRGSKAVGTIVYRTRKGAFGKSGKMEISLDYVEVGDQRIAIQGRFREEGEGNTTATVATAFFSILGSSFITGRSAEIPAGQEFTAWTKDDLPVQMLGSEGSERSLLSSTIATEQQTRAAVPPRRPASSPTLVGNGRVKCVTCEPESFRP